MSGIEDSYPLGENRPDLIQTPTGKPLEAFTVEAVLDGTITREDIAITPEALRLQAEVARNSGWDRLAENFERAAELARVPEDVVMEIYELLRPGRAAGPEPLLAAARNLREVHGAARTAAMVEEAADIYAQRGIFRRRF